MLVKPSAKWSSACKWHVSTDGQQAIRLSGMATTSLCVQHGNIAAQTCDQLS